MNGEKKFTIVMMVYSYRFDEHRNEKLMPQGSPVGSLCSSPENSVERKNE